MSEQTEAERIARIRDIATGDYIAPRVGIDDVRSLLGVIDKLRAALEAALPLVEDTAQSYGVAKTPLLMIRAALGITEGK